MRSFLGRLGIYSLAGIKSKHLPYLPSGIFPLEIPLTCEEDIKWKPHFLFKAHTRNADFISCHVSVLKPGFCPHPPHTHADEEILVLLSGEVDLILPDDEQAGEEKRRRLKKGEFVYYPDGFPHTLETVSNEPANYLMFKWHGPSRDIIPGLRFMHFRDFLPDDGFDLSEQFAIKGIFTGSTKYIKRLHSHVTRLSPGGGYDPHTDDHDVAIIMLEGEVDTLGKKARPYDVIYYAASEMHGIDNPGLQPAKYLVFSFSRNVKRPS